MGDPSSLLFYGLGNGAPSLLSHAIEWGGNDEEIAARGFAVAERIAKGVESSGTARASARRARLGCAVYRRGSAIYRARAPARRATSDAPARREESGASP